MIGSIVQGVSNLAGSIIGSHTARQNTKRTNRANRQLAEYSYSKDLEMWERQNKYNSPAMQMQRMKEAGLNPMMMYGTGTVENTAKQMPQYQAPRMEYRHKGIDPGTALSGYFDLAMKKAQVANVQAQTANTQANTTQTIEETTGTKANSALKALELKFQTEMYDSNILGASAKNQGAVHEMHRQQYSKELERMKSEWMEKGITPADNLIMRQLLLNEGIPDWAKAGMVGTALLAVPAGRVGKLLFRLAPRPLQNAIRSFLRKNGSNLNPVDFIK